jgi:hypothetical protein
MTKGEREAKAVADYMQIVIWRAKPSDQIIYFESKLALETKSPLGDFRKCPEDTIGPACALRGNAKAKK